MKNKMSIYPNIQIKSPAYALADDRGCVIAIGLSLTDAWSSAEKVLGETAKQLQKQGFRIYEGTFIANETCDHAPVLIYSEELLAKSLETGKIPCRRCSKEIKWSARKNMFVKA